MGNSVMARFRCVAGMVLAAGVLFLLPGPNVALAADWTYMVYMGGDNNLSDAALGDIEEMRQATTDESVNVVVQVEAGRNYSFNLPGYLPGYDTYRLEIRNGQVAVVDQGLGNLNMGSPDTLRDFIAWAAFHYPASRYALTIWDHGSGWKTDGVKRSLAKGAVQDETSGTYMSLAMLAQGVRDSGLHLQLLDFDACLMAMYEVAFEFVGLVDVMVFSEEVEPGDGNPYTLILSGLGANPGMNARTLGTLIAREFVNSYRGTRQSATKSAVDMAAVPELHSRIVNLAAVLQGALAVNGPFVANARAAAQAYYERGNLDLVSVLGNLQVAGGELGIQAESLASFVAASVVVANEYYSSGHTEGGIIGSGNVDRSRGLAIFFPSVDILRQGEFAVYQGIGSSVGGGWSTFLEAFLNGTGGGPGSTGAVAMTSGRFAYGSIWFDANGELGLTDVDLYVLEPDGTIGAPWIGESTPNGYYSPDSIDSGMPIETYGAKDRVMSGTYVVVVNYYDDFWSWSYYEDFAHVFLISMDPLYGIDFWQLNQSGEFYKPMGLWNPAPDIWTDKVIYGIIYGFYSDWWVPGIVTRNLRAVDFETLKGMLLDAKVMSESRRGKNVRDNLLRLFNAASGGR